ncbi:MAG: hypothetical protein RL033_1749 [Pseudomonadota bacterium]
MSAPTATGNLHSTPFCELLIYALSQTLTGSLVLECPDRTKHAVLFVAGIAAKARVNHAGTRLGQVLLQLGSVTAEALRVALETDSDELLGQRLFASGALDTNVLTRALGEQLQRQLSWLAGAPPATAFAYYSGVDLLEDWGGEPLRIDPLAAIWRAVDAHAPPERVAAALEGVSDKILRLHPDSRVARFEFTARMRGLLDVLKVKPQTLSALDATGLLDRMSLHKLVYTLVLTRHLDTGAAPLGVVPGSRSQVGPAVRPGQSQVGPAVRPGQSQLGPAVRPPASQPGVAARSSQSQTGPKVSAVRPQVAAAPPAAAQPVAARPAVAKPPSTRQAPEVAPAAPVERANAETLQTGRFLGRDEIEAKLARFDELDHYELLELPPDATPEQILQAFPLLARRWHPDRLSPEYSELRESATRIFARMTEANRVLTNPTSRKTYDQSLGRNTDSPSEQDQVVQVLRSAEAFQKAEILLRKRDLEGAEALARLAHEGDPDQPEYAGLYAFIRARRPDAKEEDIATSLGMLKKAIGKQGDNVKIHYYLACVLKAAGQVGPAIREYRYVAERDPSNVDAARELRLHEMRKGNSKQPPAAGEAGLFGKLFKR